jgi:threonine dehydrogenase-like Zn-dependent dehydrogenase
MTTPRGTLTFMPTPGSLEYLDFDVPEPEPGALVMKVTRANVCGSELHIWNGKHPSKKSGGIGHEMVGTVASLGDGVVTDNAGEPLAVGDRIVAPYFLTCERCFHCLRGEWNLCDNAYEFYGKQPQEWPHFHTAFATHFYVHPRQYVYKVPANVPDSIAAGANCALSQVLFGIHQAGFVGGDTLLVQGAGGLGLYATAIADQLGMTTIVVDGVAARLEQATKFGATQVVDIAEHPDVEERRAYILSLTGGRGADAAVEVTGVPAAFSEGLTLLRRGGHYLVMGNLSPGVIVDYDPGLMTRKALTVQHLDRYEPRFLHKALDFVSSNMSTYPFEDLVDATFGLHEIEEALDASAARKVTRASILIS